ncbi:YihY/virulence factor BrkB family protein [uncultured Prevotella sp.]|uniref:YihY/virulence factor BrkB family protein n=1 Tax=uncultured Prevotella sp. TaxID=159272 RepID=UPI0027DC3551|nr:YihY/virulence factor BrkB family protein [uncultured Prevotella sp.]
MTIKNITDFYKVGIWRDYSNKPQSQRLIIASFRMLILTIESFTTKRMINNAAALTYSTLLAIVPILAVVFAIARGFGYNKYIEEWFRNVLSSQPQAAETIIGFVNSYLIHTKSGIILGIGLVFMLWTVTMLIRNIELAFNNIWQVKKPRSFFRTVTDYMGMFILAPIIIVVTSGISIFVATVTSQTKGMELFAPMVRTLWDIMPFVLMSAIFIALYVFMPNIRVKLKCAIWPGILAGVAMQGLQLFYIHSQIWVSSYNAIYGSFAALPLFMLWVQISWSICLFGAELCYTSQNMEEYAFRTETYEISPRYRMIMSMLIMSMICKRFEKGESPYTALELKLNTNIPIRITQNILYELIDLGLINEISGDEKGDVSVYQPAQDISRLSVGRLIDKYETKGKWELKLNMSEANHEKWNKVIAEHSAYLKKQREILLKDL